METSVCFVYNSSKVMQDLGKILKEINEKKAAIDRARPLPKD